MALASVAKASVTNLRAEADTEMEMLNLLNGIHALAELLQKAHEGSEDAHSGVYGTAFIIEQKAHRLLTLIGQA